MATSLATVRTRVRTLLDDAALALWSDAELQEHIEAALRDLSVAVPREQKTALATTASSRDVTITSLADRVTIEAVEYKTGADPKTYVPFSVWGDTLTLLGDAVPDGANCNVYWTSLHLINGTSTLPTRFDAILELGACLKACEQQAADTTNAANTGGGVAPRDWAGLADRFRQRYERRLNKARGVRVRASAAPDQPHKRQQANDPGP